VNRILSTRFRLPRAAALGIVLGLVWAFAGITACTPRTPPATAPAPVAQPAPRPAPAPPVPAAPPAVPAPAAGGPPAAPRPPAPPPLLGHLTRAMLQDYESWKPLFAAQPPYAPDAASVAAIKAGAGDVTVVLVMATWCPDSKRELPRYFAIMDAAGVPDRTLTMVGVDRTKKDTEGLTEKWGITRVPTFVFLRKGQEVGRVVERVPAGSTLEAEIAKVLGSK